MTTSTSDGVHFLLLATDLWTDVPTVVGIFTTAADAVDAAGTATQDTEPETQRFTLEEWQGTARQSSTTIIEPDLAESVNP
ncbi:hypothetical protein MT356_20660 [Rathayibacter festucae]|uniref:hypothetical protein n=1 Tax=Rathayibacter festucae TaxID=110937 RepID=UPI001FB55FCE|nr:hypothetical protein [Rathayibacter festucae]MCJ1702130.1 hypothetical protein [Rathayibacter festucae]